MMKKIVCLLALSIPGTALLAQTDSKIPATVDSRHVQEGFYVHKLSLKGSSLPNVRIAEPVYEVAGSVVPDSLVHSSSLQPEVLLGVERKQPYAFIKVPVYRKNAETGVIEKLTHFELALTEKAASNVETAGRSTARITSASSVLASGTWKKIAVPARGVYKIDYDFVKNKLGNSGAITSGNIRLFGNGGTMLYEQNYVARPDDLVENPIEMHDGGDGVFGSGDYFLFYANGPIEWTKDSSKQQFHHRTNLYADSSYYFITFDKGAGLRLPAASATGAATTTVTTYNDYALHEKDLINLGQFGKIWWGETFGFDAGYTPSQTFTFPADRTGDSIYVNYQLAAAAVGKYVTNASRFTTNFNGNLLATHSNLWGVGGSDGDDPGYMARFTGMAMNTGSPTLNFTITYQKFVDVAKGYLDYIEINTRRQLYLNNGSQMGFRDWRSVAPGAVAGYRVENANANTRVWDVTDPLHPQLVNGSLSGSVYSFNGDASALREYVAFEATGSFPAPSYNGTVANQDLHGQSAADYVIVTREDMLGAANKLAEYHRSATHLNVVVATTAQVYNEFSSGAQDISAIRDLMRMFYDRAGTDASKMPRYLLLLGPASYDYRNITVKNIKAVPTYETPESLIGTAGYCSDDFFGILDSAEYIDGGSVALMDIGVGRIPATDSITANAVVAKILRYKSPQALGAWRINNVFIGDYEDEAGPHMTDADEMSGIVAASSNSYNATKVYLNNMSIISTPAGDRCPDANKAVNDNIYKGTFLFNFSGHGSIYALSKKRVLTQDDYMSWKNNYRLPIMVTATCDFSRFDNPAAQSAGEKLILKSDGGAIALMTTTQVVYQDGNRLINSAYLSTQFNKTETAGWYSFGDAFRISKNAIVGTDVSNTRKFALLGDPALVPAFPRYDVRTDSVMENGSVRTDSVKSLGTYTIAGSVRDDMGNVMNNFNGKVSITFYDKAQTNKVVTYWGAKSYQVQNNLIYKGTATVSNGLFSFSFITPKDINYDLGKGKISYYADNGSDIDASGADTSITVGGFMDDVVADEDAPVVRGYMNDSLFVNGSITGTNSVLFAIVSDKSGINASGNSVGHDLTAVLDDVVEAPYVLNDYYETAPNTYQRGYITFPMTGLADGKHTLRVKVWDVFNNSGEGTVAFEVLNGNVMEVRNLYNYPNPFTDMTHFVFDHNHPGEELTATIYIFNSAGSLVRTLEQTFSPSGSKTAELVWDGTGNGGEKLFPGIYPYRIRIATATKKEDIGYQKVILQR
jgi:hypothetical protein